MKVARRHSLGASDEVPATEVGVPATGFVALGPLGNRMEVGFPKDFGPRDLHMVDFGAGSLKCDRSPPKASTSIARGISSLSMVVSSPEGSLG